MGEKNYTIRLIREDNISIDVKLRVSVVLVNIGNKFRDAKNKVILFTISILSASEGEFCLRLHTNWVLNKQGGT